MQIHAAARAALLALALAISTPAFSAAPAEERAAVAAGLKARPIYVAIERYFPEVFKEMVDRLAEGLASSRPMGDLIQELRPLYSALLARETPKADVANTRLFMTLGRDQALAALKRSPHDCLIILGVSSDRTLPADILPEALIEQEFDYAAKLFAQTATRPQPLPPPLSQSALQSLASQVYDTLPSDALRAAFTQIGGSGAKATTPVQQEAVCRFSTNLMDVLLAKPGSEGTDAFRALTFATTVKRAAVSP
jgi:hypothetical protein